MNEIGPFALGRVHRGDCRDLMRRLPVREVAAVIGDPPYLINTKSDGRGKLNPWADMVNGSIWYADILRLTRRLVGDLGAAAWFLNWRSLVTYQKAACDVRWPIESLVIWDKDWIGPGGNRGFRPCYEMIAVWAGERFGVADRGARDLVRVPWASHKPTGHPAEKPVELKAWLIGHLTKPGDLVLDPFAGSGTTGIACQRLGRRFLGFELDPYWCDYANRRLGATPSEADTPLFAEPAA